MILSVEFIYIVMGIIGLCCSIYILVDRSNPRRIPSGLFYLLYSITILFGRVIPPFYVGLMVMGMVVIVACGGLKKGDPNETAPAEREVHRKRLGNFLFLPALLIPILTVLGAKLVGKVKIGTLFLFDPDKTTLIALGVACMIAILAAMMLTKSTPRTGVKETKRLLEAIGWAIVLPQLLATLGTIFTKAGVGTVVSEGVTKIIPESSLFWIVVVFLLGMAGFTIIMGNAFAAFPIMAAGVAIPFLINNFDVNPNQLAAIAMFAGYCGTLLTPMAANFNIVPAALLDLRDKNHVIRAQAPTAIIVLVFNILLMYFLIR